VYDRTLSPPSPSLVKFGNRHGIGSSKSTTRAKKITMSVSHELQNSFYRVRIKDGHNAGLLVSTAGKRCIPSTHFWLTVDACSAYRFPHDAALRVQVRLGNIGFTTVLEKIQD